MIRRRQWHPTLVLLPGKPHGRRSLVGCSPWGRWRLGTTERLHFHFSLSCTGEGNGNPLQCSCLENPRDRGAWWAAVYEVAQSWTWLKWLSSSSSNSKWKFLQILSVVTLKKHLCFGYHCLRFTGEDWRQQSQGQFSNLVHSVTPLLKTFQRFSIPLKYNPVFTTISKALHGRLPPLAIFFLIWHNPIVI